MKTIKKVELKVDFISEADDFIEVAQEALGTVRLKNIKKMIGVIVFALMTVVSITVLYLRPELVFDMENGGEVPSLVAAISISILIGALSAGIGSEIVELFIYDTDETTYLIKNNTRAGLRSIVKTCKDYKRNRTNNQEEAFRLLRQFDFLTCGMPNWYAVVAIKSHGCLVQLDPDNRSVTVFDRSTNKSYSVCINRMCAVDEQSGDNILLILGLDNATAVDEDVLSRDSVSLRTISH